MESEHSESIWETCTPSEEKIRNALTLLEQGKRAWEVSSQVGLGRSEMLYWVSQYKRGRRWDQSQN